MFSESLELDEKAQYVIRDTDRPARSFLLQPAVLVRATRRDFCNGILFDRRASFIPGTAWDCVGVRMIDEEKGEFGETVTVCHYQEILFKLEIIEFSEVSRQQADGDPVVDAKWFPRMKVRLV